MSRIIEERGNTDFHTLTHSSGNAGQAIALASSMKGVQAKVVMPLNAPVSKKNATEGYGAEIFRCENSSEARSKMTQEIADKNPDKAEYIPSADHPFMMEGQGTITLEMLEQQPDLDALVIACSVGGMIAGMAKACKLVKPNVKVFAVEPDRADDLAQSFKTGKQVKLSAYPDTIADGLRMSVGDQTWPVIRETVEPDVLLVTEEEIKKSMYLIFERMKLVVEPSAAVVLAAVLTDQFRSLSGGLNNIGLVLCGGNPDLKSLPW